VQHKKRLYGVSLEIFGFQYDLYLHAGTVTRDHTYLQAQGTLQSYVLACNNGPINITSDNEAV